MRNPGSNSDVLSKDIFLLASLLLVIGYVAGLTPWLNNRQPDEKLIFFFVSLVLLLGVAVLSIRLFKDIDNRIMGLKGEFKTSILLDSLWSKGVRSIDDITLGSHGNIDHIAVSKTGVWVIETKAIKGTISFINGELASNGNVITRQPPLKQTYAEAKSVERFLVSKGVRDVIVRPILVFVRSKSKVRLGEEPVNGVYTIGSAWLERLILHPKFGDHLSQARIDQIINLFPE